MAVSDNESTVNEVMSTPLQGLKNKLKDLRRKSTHVKREEDPEEKPFDRRATFGVPNPNTPKTRSTDFEQRGMSSAAPLSRFMPKLEKTLDDRMTGETDLGNLDVEEHALDKADDDCIDEDSQGDEEVAAASETGSNDDLEEHNLEADREANEDGDVQEEPSVDEIEIGQKHSATSPATPMLKGLREMMRTPKAAPGTPCFAGMREMFTEKPQLATPEMSGIVDLFPELASSRREAMGEEQHEATSSTGSSASRLPTRSRIAGSTVKDTQAKIGTRTAAAAPRARAKPTAEVGSTSKTTASAPTTGVRRARAAPAPEAVASTQPKATRTRQAQELASSTSTEEPSVPVKKTAARVVRTRTATAAVEEKPVTKATAKPPTRTAPIRTRAKSAAPEPAPVEPEDGEVDPLEDISVPEPDPEDIKPIRKTTRTATTTRTAVARPLATRSALPQPTAKAESTEVEKPKPRTRAAPASTSRVLKSSTEPEEVAAAAPKRATRAAAGSRLTAPTASSKARATPPPPAPAAPVRKTRAAVATIAEGSEGSESSGIPKRVTRARK